MAIAWEGFLDDARLGNCGGTFEFFDTEAQVVIIRNTDDALISTYDTVDLGQWFDSVWENNLRIGNFGLSQFVPRHGYNGEIWAVGITPTLVAAETGRFPTPSTPAGFYLYRYKYYHDLTNYISRLDTNEQSENPIKDAGLTLKNLGEGDINKTSSLFAVGSRMVCKIGMGTSSKVYFATVFLDEIDWEAEAETMRITGRNALGYFLADQTFDETRTFTGTRITVLQDMLTGTGINMAKVIIDPSGTVASNPTFAPTETILSGLNYVLDVWGWKVKELPNGNIIIGTPTFLETYAPITVHSLNSDEAFMRGINQSSDGAYSRIALQSYINEITGPPIVPAWTRTVFKDINYLDSWVLGSRRTLYISVLDDMAEVDMETLADEYAKAYQYIGINMTRELSIHPEISTGDPFEISDLVDGQFMVTGIITNVVHTIDIDAGTARTFLSVNSGGTVVIGSTIETYTAFDVSGDTRRRELIDVIKKEAKSIADAKIKKV